MRKLLILVLVVAVLVGAVFGVTGIEKYRITGLWQERIDFSEDLLQLYLDALSQHSEQVDLRGFNIANVASELKKQSTPAFYVPVILELDENGRYHITAQDDDFEAAIDRSLDYFNQKAAHQVVYNLLSSTDRTISQAISLGSDAVLRLFNIDLNRIADKFLSSVLEYLVTDQLNRAEMINALKAKLDVEGTYRVFLRTLFISFPDTDHAENAKKSAKKVRFSFHGKALFLESSETPAGYLAEFFNQELRPA